MHVECVVSGAQNDIYVSMKSCRRTEWRLTAAAFCLMSVSPVQDRISVRPYMQCIVDPCITLAISALEYVPYDAHGQVR